MKKAIQAKPSPAKPPKKFIGKRLSDLQLAEALGEMKRRCFGLEAATVGVGSYKNHDERCGLIQLAHDIATEMERLAEAFETERQLRMAEER